MRRVLPAMVAALLVGACGGGGPDPGGASARPCEGLLSPANPAATLPVDLPAADGQTVYEKATQGATTIWFAYARGADVVASRDALKAKFAAAGYTRLDDDAEPPAEAELQFEGTYTGSVQVVPLCAGYLRIRYRVSR